MATSKSTRENRNYFAGVSIFSGRPDPTWPVTQGVASGLLNLFDTCATYDGPSPSAPPLGYRGAFLRDDAGNEWYTYRGVVTAKGAGIAEVRLDANRAFERTLIDSAPKELIPSELLDKEFH